MMHRKTFLIFTAAALVLFGMTGCSMLIRQNPPKAAPAPAKKQAEASGELTAEQLLAMTPEQLEKYHAEKRAKQEREDAAAQKRAAKQTPAANNRKGGQELVDSFMTDRPSREKRRRLGDVSRQLDYSETSIFPWRDGRRSESLNRRY
jgi:hypothetical protein